MILNTSLIEKCFNIWRKFHIFQDILNDTLHSVEHISIYDYQKQSQNTFLSGAFLLIWPLVPCPNTTKNIWFNRFSYTITISWKNSPRLGILRAFFIALDYQEQKNWVLKYFKRFCPPKFCSHLDTSTNIFCQKAFFYWAHHFCLCTYHIPNPNVTMLSAYESYCFLLCWVHCYRKYSAGNYFANIFYLQSFYSLFVSTKKNIFCAEYHVDNICLL